MGLFDGKVVAVTGAGGGIGREYALAFAREGAKVVVNDLGGARDGAGHGNAMADHVVAEIREAGGTAAPNYDSVATMEGAQNIVKTAVESFGRLDILVNNAGILRDKTILKMSEQEFDIVVAVHLKGTWACSRFAAEQMIEQGGGGRIINTSSYAGLKGNFGQSNYGAAKAGIAGLTRVLALEFGRKGITVNCIAPLAKTRLTDDIDMIPDQAKPEFMVPMVLFLASELGADVNGRIFGCHVNHYFEYRMELTAGVDKGAEPWTAKEVAARLKEISISRAEMAPPKKAEGAGDAGPGAQCLAVLSAMPAAFAPEKAGDWSAVLHFLIAGAGDYTMTVNDGRAEVAEGKKGEATCVVKLDAETFLGMATGKVDGNQAFMQGKISASNIKDMIKYGTSFDQKKARAAASEALAKVHSGGGGDRIAQIFDAVASGFLKEKAGDWAAVLHFVLAGADSYTMTVDDGACRVEKGLTGTATCVVKTDAETFIGMAEGKVDGNQAFMQGKVSATNIKDMIKYGTCFDGKAIKKKLAALAGPKAEEPAVERPQGLNRACLGRKGVMPPVLIQAEHTVAYAKATNDLNPQYVESGRGGGIIAPVLFPVRLLHPAMARVVADPELNVDYPMVLHGEQDMRFHQPLRPLDLIRTETEITRIEAKSSGEVFDVTGRLTRDGELVCESVATIFIRSRDKSAGGQKEPKAEPELPSFTFEEPMVVRPNQSYEYADASGDRNPIHIDEGVAKAVGLGGIILHGLCTMAFTSQAVIKHAAGGDATRLRRLKVRFSRPVKPKDELKTQGWVVDEKQNVVIVG
ncbi:MAG: SDR family NAD(P)-dependent oxidoreductase, partial [Myxococcales bacterium]|nr:SDR family NAD(P)-dependent oxidoreductase [Myxococcales bacterium]